MAVLVEAISIIIRKSAIDELYSGGWSQFTADAPNATVCGDGVLVRVGFLTAVEAEAFAGDLESHGLVHRRLDEAADFVCVDQVAGPLEPCRWLSFGVFDYGRNGHVSACWYCDNPWVHWGAVTPDVQMDLATPDGWEYERSLSYALNAGRARRVKAGSGGASSIEPLLRTPRPTPPAPTQNRLH